MSNDKCYFDRGNYCSALTGMNCDRCTFRKTGLDYIDGKKKADERLERLGLEVYIKVTLDQKVITTRKKASRLDGGEK